MVQLSLRKHRLPASMAKHRTEKARNDNKGIKVICYQKANLISNQTPALKKWFPTNPSFPLWSLISEVSQGLKVRHQTILLIDNKSLPILCNSSKFKKKKKKSYL